MQDALPAKKTDSRNTSQLILIAVGIILLVLIIIGVVNDASADPAAFGPTQPFLALAILAFLGGALSFLSPCTLPILPAYFAFATSSGRRHIASNTMMFILGLATVFSLFGASASALGSLLRQYQDLILIVGGALVVIFGVMSLLGKGFSGVSAEADTGPAGGGQAGGLGGSFVFGMTFAAGWSSCIGPILGIMLTMAATTASVLRGGILLFIFALGLGIPLLIVSTFIGRASRQSLVWRLLRGKGWFVNVPTLLIALIWSLAAWLIGLALITFAFDNFAVFAGREITAGLNAGLLGLSVAGGLLWTVTLAGNPRRTELHLHSTSLFSAALFLFLGYFMLSGRLTAITAEINNFTIQSGWYDNLVVLEEWLFAIFN